ncbi:MULTISPECIES: NACHT domain-containing protein [Cupriavidus]
MSRVAEQESTTEESEPGMAEKADGASLADAGLKVFDALWAWTGTSETWRIVVVIAVIVVVGLAMLTAFCGALGKLFEGASKLIETYKASGLPRFMGREQRLKIRRRSQFCAVLEADLTNLTKAESWNDQYFTDLEAEVETEGGYYISPLHRFLGKVSTGLRKERSLIKAISSSSERAIQLTGEPGSGKSVALRHLAGQLAVRAKASKAKVTLVPLYINLREITVPTGAPITADTIRDFILDNIRRGDSDTTAYVRENWADYRERGIWFFLFDSFDEIPAVLHAEKGSPVTKDYAEAIRMFLEGMGGCRGILASREFKGPESLPWKKFRILRLTSRKQQELVANAFLSPDHERQVLHHLATNGSTLANTPLFLTLLCQYVKEAKKAPKNDYELLSLQIDRLAGRDPLYLRRVYGLTAVELLSGAQRIARLFAEESSLGLAPTIDQVEAVLDKRDIPGGDIQRFVAAMVDCKIARADVANAAPGDRRFAFAHRRYQEALFVRHLVAHPGYLSDYDLLTDPRWREYSVTLLETQPDEALHEMFAAAAQILTNAAASQRRRHALDPLGQTFGYFEWMNDAAQMLSLLQEGLARRVATIPMFLSEAVRAFLEVRWESGDAFDRIGVMRVAALLPQTTLSRYLEETFSTGSDKAQSEGFRQTASLIGTVPIAVRRAVLKRLADEILGAKDSSALLRMEALVARLPRDLGAEYVQRRCRLLWRMTQLVSSTELLTLSVAVLGLLMARIPRQQRVKNQATLRTRAALVFGGIGITYIPLLLLMGFGTAKASLGLPLIHVELPSTPSRAALGLAIAGCYVLAISIYLFFPLLFSFRAIGEPLTFGFFIRRYGRQSRIIGALKTIAFTVLMIAGVGVICYGIGAVLSFSARKLVGYTPTAPDIVLGLGVAAVLMISSTVYMGLSSIRRRRISSEAFNTQVKSMPADLVRVMLVARDWKQLGTWILLWDSHVRAGMATSHHDEQVRSLSAALQHVQRGGTIALTVARFAADDPDKRDVADCLSSLESLCDPFATTRSVVLATEAYGNSNSPILLETSLGSAPQA